MDIDVKGVIISNDEAWIYDWFEMDYTTPRKITNALREAKNEKIDVYINSGGGDIFAGSEIAESLRQYPGECKIHVVGLAASAASVIACARKSDIAPTAMVMVHNVSSSARGDTRALAHEAEVLKKANKSIASAYVQKTGMTEAEALEMMNNETWLTAQEAVNKGLIDELSVSVNPVVQLVASYNSGMLPRSVIDKFINERNAQKMQAKLNLLKLGGN